MNNAKLSAEIDRLIGDGESLLKTEFVGDCRGRNLKAVELQRFSTWKASCLNLMRLLGKAADKWEKQFGEFGNSSANAEVMLGTLRGIRNLVDAGLLVTVEDLVLAEAFNNLLDQADYLAKKGYFLAAGVLGRAVLEEHLRAWAVNAAAAVTAKRPTLNDYVTALYKAGKFTVSVLKHVEAMAAVGNDAAHNKTSLTPEAVERLLRDVREFIGKYP
jgi:hypothetical protein